MAQVELQRGAGHQQKRERGQQRQPIGRLDGFDVEDALKRRQDERAGNQAGDIRVEDDEDAQASSTSLGYM